MTDLGQALHNTAVSDKNTLPRGVLLTGFDAFGGDTMNPSWLAVQELRDEVIAGHTVIAAQLPTAFAWARLVGEVRCR